MRALPGDENRALSKAWAQSQERRREGVMSRCLYIQSPPPSPTSPLLLPLSHLQIYHILGLEHSPLPNPPSTFLLPKAEDDASHLLGICPLGFPPKPSFILPLKPDDQLSFTSPGALTCLTVPGRRSDTSPGRIKIGSALAPQREISPSALLALPLRPGPATPDRYLGNREGTPLPLPPPSTLHTGVAAGPWGSLPSPPPCLPSQHFLPGDPCFPPAPGPQRPARRPRPHRQARLPPEGYATQRRGAGGTRPSRRLRRRPPQRPPRRARPARLPAAATAIPAPKSARGGAPPPPRLPGLSGPRLAAPPRAPSSSCSAIGCGSPPAFT
ncbi:hypothetical protein R6Z07F_017799 [Ovis aries]